jgi:anti-repressor protein|nr:MAG TPA: repressor domain protein [Bacteriophage sp.]
MQELEIFKNEEFGEVRTVMIGKKPYFCASDVAKALGYLNQRDAIKRHCKGVVKHDILTNGGKQEFSFIPEGDVYRLIIKSKLPNAQKFESWVMDEVLPTIRKHGAYMTEQTLEKALTSPDFLIQLATQLKQEQEARKLAEQTIEKQRPLVEFANKVSDSSNVIDMGRMAKLLKDEKINIGRNRLFQWLRQKEILMTNNIPYQRYIDAGYFQVKESTYETPFGTKTQQTTYVTGKGQLYITEKLRIESTKEIA